jgi:hypothetical protein
MKSSCHFLFNHLRLPTRQSSPILDFYDVWQHYCSLGTLELNCCKPSLSLILRPTVSRPVYLEIKHPPGAYDKIFITVRQLRVCWCGALSLLRGRVFYNCSWPSPAQLFSGPSPVGLVTIFYCLRFETSLFVASYDSQGYGGGIRPRLHTGTLPSNELRVLL